MPCPWNSSRRLCVLHSVAQAGGLRIWQAISLGYQPAHSEGVHLWRTGGNRWDRPSSSVVCQAPVAMATGSKKRLKPLKTRELGKAKIERRLTASWRLRFSWNFAGRRPWVTDHRMSDVGGTPGGLGDFVIGFAMSCVGGYLLSNQVSVVGSYWSFYGGTTFGITLLPMLIGVGILFWNGRSLVGWLLTIAGTLFILTGVIA